MGQFDADVVDFAAEQAKRQPAPAVSPVMGGTMAPAAQVPATVQPGPFDEAVAEYGQSQHQAATGNIIAGHGSNPDAAGKALTLAPQVGVPPGVVDTDLAGFEAQHRIAQNSKIAGGNPRMADWLAGDPMRARVSMDDFEHLDGLSKLSTALGSGWDAALLGNQRGRLGAEAALGAQNEAQVAKVERDLAAHPQLGGIWGKLQTVAGFAGGMTDNLFRGVWTGLQGLAVGAVAGGAATAPTGPGVVPGAITGGGTGLVLGTGVGFKYDMAKVAAGNTYLDLSEAVGKDGQKIDPVAKDAAALLVGMGTYVLAGVGTKNVAKPAGEAASKFLADAVKESVTRPTVQMALKKFGTEMAKAGVTGAALNMAMEGTSIFGEEFGKQLSGGQDFETLFNNPAQRQQAVDHLITAATDGAMLFPLVHGVIGTPGLVMDSLRARQSKADVQTFQALETGAAANKTRERSLGAFQSFMEHQTGGTPVENLSITGEAVRTLYQSKGIEPGPGDGLLGDVVPGLKEQLEQSAATGGDIVVPTAAYVAHLAGTPVSEALRADIRFRPDGMTMKEAAQYEAERGAHLADLATQGQASLDAALVAAEPGRMVHADIEHKLRAAGVSADAAAQYAALVAARYEARAERLGYKSEYPFTNAVHENSFVVGQADAARGDHLAETGYSYRSLSQLEIENIRETGAALSPGKSKGGRQNTKHWSRANERLYYRPDQDVIRVKNEKLLPNEPVRAENIEVWNKETGKFEAIGSKTEYRPAERSGRGSAWDLYRAEGLDVRRETPESLRHVATDESDLVINALRNDNRKAPKPRELFGPSLHEAVKEAGGIVDSGGELKAMDLDKAKTKGLIRKATGDATDDIHHSMDAMALRMWEMGYFPDKMERPTEQDLIDAMRNGDAHYAEGVGNERKAAFEEAVRDLDEFVNRQGIDVKKASNAEIKAAIDKHIADEQAQAGRTLMQGGDKTATPEFKAWFGDSKVVDADGKPQVVYHGTAKKFPAFSKNKATMGGITWFTSDRAAIEKGEVGAQGKGHIFDLYASIKNPAGWKEYDQLGLGELKSRGYDGVILPEKDGTFTGFVFEPEQLKSVENRGTFDPNDKRLMYQGERGRISLDNGRATITLFKDADLSTFLHETGHLWLEELGRDALDIAAPDGLKSDWQAVKQWLGAEPKPLTEKEFYRQYVQHIDIRGRGGKAIETRDAIMRDGFKKAGNVNALPPSRGGEPLTVVDAKFAPREGDVVYLAPKGAWEDAPNGPQIKEGWKPKAHEVVTITDPSKSMYENYVEALGKSEQPLTTEQHEQFARGFENYLMDGRAPSSALASAFRKFKSWLIRIYKSAATLKVPMNDEIRGVFDRMIASDDAIKNWREAESLRPVFADAKSAGMTDAEFTAYSKAIDKAANSADEKMLRKSMEAVRKARTKEWKEEAASVRADVEPEVKARPDLRAQYFLRTGKDLADPEAPAVEPVRLSREALDDMYGTDEASKALPSGIISAKDGVHPDEVADLFGYRSGDEMVRALMSLEASRKQAEEATGEKLDGNKYVRKLVDDRVQETMLERHGDALNDGSIEAEALAAVHNAAQADVMSMEARAIARQAGVTALRKEDISIWADRQLDDMPADRATDVRSFARQEAKAGREVQRALLKGDAAAAFEAKQRQLINHILATKAAEALEQHTKDVSLLRKLGKTPRRETVQQSFMDQIHSITERLGIQTKRTEADAAATPSLNKFVSDQAAIGQDVFMPEVLLNERFTGDVDTMKLGDFFDAMEGVQSLLNLGRAMRKMEVDGEQIHFAEIVDDMRTQVGDVAASAVGMEARATSLDKIKVDALGIVAALKRVENWALLMDKGNRQGPFTRYIVKPVFEATEKYRPEKQRRLQQLWDILEPRRKELNQGKIFSPELNYTFVNKGELLHAIGHTGNESNMTKLLVGRGWGELDADGNLDRSRWDSALDRMHSDGTIKQADYDTVQKIWDLLEEIKPAAQEAHKSIYGVRFDEVTAATVQTPWGEYRGGYMPAIVDRFIVDDGKLRDDVDALKQQQTGGMFPSTGRGFTKSRVANYNKALELNLSLIPSHIDSVLRFTHLQPTIREVGRLMLKPGFRDMMRGADPAAVSSMLVPWLQRTARQTVTTPALDPAGRAADKVFNALRRRSGVQILAFNVSNTLQQFVGIAPGVLKSSPGAMMRSLYTFMRQPKTMADEIAAASPYMDERMRGKSFDLQVSIEKALTSTNKFTDFRYWSQENSHVFQHLAQNMVDIVTWRAAYEHETGKGVSNADAVHAANAAVRETQGGFNPEEVSRFETGGALGRLFTHMYSYFGSQANLIGTEVALTKDMGFKKGAARNAMIYTFGLMIPAVISDAIYRTISGSGQQDTEDGSPWDMETLASQFLGSQAKYMAGMVPIAGPVVVAAFDSNAGDRIGSSPTASSIKQAAKAPGEIYDSLVEGKAPSRGIRDGLTALGLATGLPLGQAGRPLGYAADVATGHQTPTSAADVARGLMTGKQGEGAVQ